MAFGPSWWQQSSVQQCLIHEIMKVNSMYTAHNTIDSSCVYSRKVLSNITTCLRSLYCFACRCPLLLRALELCKVSSSTQRLRTQQPARLTVVPEENRMLLCAFAGTTCGSARTASLLLLCFPSRRKSLHSMSPGRSGSRASDAPAAGTTIAGGAAGSPTTRLYSGKALPPRITTSCKQQSAHPNYWLASCCMSG
jgi:hypothetical protein